MDIDPRVQQYLDSLQRRNDPSYWKSLRDEQQSINDSTSDANLSAGLMGAAAQFGVVNGKQVASAQPVEDYAKGVAQLNAQKLGQMNAAEQRQTDLDKVYANLMARQDAMKARKEDAEASQAFKSQENEKDRQFKKELLDNKNSGNKPLKWDIVQGQTGPNGEPILYNKDTAEFKTGVSPEGAKAVGREKAAGSPQYLAAGFGRRIEQASQEMDQLAKEGYNRSAFTESIKASLPGFAQSENVKRQEQAERNFVNAVLRRESGAAISPSEFKSAEMQYFPRAGDTPLVLAQKKRNREQTVANLRAEAGNAWNQVPLVGVNGLQGNGPNGFETKAYASPSSNGQRAPVKMLKSPSTGKTKIIYSDGTEEIR